MEGPNHHRQNPNCQNVYCTKIFVSFKFDMLEQGN